MVVGGMFNVLEAAIKVIEKEDNVYFTKENIKELTGLSDQAVSNNISRLLKSGFLIKEEYFKSGFQGRFTRYRLKCGDINELVRLYFS